MQYRQLSTCQLDKMVKNEGIYTFINGATFLAMLWSTVTGSQVYVLYHIDGELCNFWRELPTASMRWSWLQDECPDFFLGRWADHSNCNYTWADVWILPKEICENLRWTEHEGKPINWYVSESTHLCDELTYNK